MRIRQLFMGDNDSPQGIRAWLNVRRWMQVLDQFTSIALPGGAVVNAPQDAWLAGVDCRVRACWPTRPPPLRLTALDRYVGRLPEFGPYLDVSFRAAAGMRQTVEFPLCGQPPPGSEVIVRLRVDR